MKWSEVIDEKYLPYLIGGAAVAAAIPLCAYFWERYSIKGQNHTYGKKDDEPFNTRAHRIDVSKYPRDKVTLFQFIRGPWAPSLSPFCIKLETYLRMANIPYQNELGFQRSSKGKIPWMIYEGQAVADSHFCIQHLNQARGLDLNSALSDEQRATAWAYQVLMEDHFVWTLALWRWVYGLDNPESKTFMVKALGPFASSVLGFARRDTTKRTRMQGIGHHSKQEVIELGTEDLRAVSKFLGEKPFLMGSDPCENDCALFGMLTQVLWHLPDSPFEDLLKGELHNLVAYCERMKERFWPDWDQCITHGCTQDATK